jgi:outer membrane protein assembly factor BamE
MRIKVIFISILLASCSNFQLPERPTLVPHKIEIQQGNLITPEMREKLKLGMSPALVRSIMGTPLITDPFHAKQWDYMYSLEKGAKLVETQRLTLYFDGDRLTRIDDSQMPLLAQRVSAVSGVPDIKK